MKDTSKSMTNCRMHMKRSKTIALTDVLETLSRPDDLKIPEVEELPSVKSHISGPSCQALRHAVSSLTRLDDFVKEKIGEGFFAEVFKVTHKVSGQIMVLKMNTDSGNRHNMLREVQLMNRLSHPNILRFIGVCVHEGQLHALTEYINGGSLDRILANECFELPWTTRLGLSVDIAKGMEYLHSRGWFHRDLTSKNVLVRISEGKLQAVVADFGLAAKIPNPMNKSEKLSIVGSPYWIAPEVLNGEWYNEKADVFSYGIISCEITARIEADPDVMPRTARFGLDYVKFCEKVFFCPLDYLRLTFRCCQIDPNNRSTFAEIVQSLTPIHERLLEDQIRSCEGFVVTESPISGHKRSKSEDNILNITDNMYEEHAEPLTPQVLGFAMSKDDPFYSPSENNPFAAFKYDGKLLGTPRNRDSMGFDLPSPSDAITPPCTPKTPDPFGRKGTVLERRSLSLPSSPVLLRKIAEQNHQESLHGSNSRKNSAVKLSAFCPRSKSTIFPEEVAHRLQSEIDENSNRTINEEEWTLYSKTWDIRQSRNINKKHNRKLCVRRQLSEDSQTRVISASNQTQESHFPFENDGLCETAFDRKVSIEEEEYAKPLNVSYQKSDTDEVTWYQESDSVKACPGSDGVMACPGSDKVKACPGSDKVTPYQLSLTKTEKVDNHDINGNEGSKQNQKGKEDLPVPTKYRVDRAIKETRV